MIRAMAGQFLKVFHRGSVAKHFRVVQAVR